MTPYIDFRLGTPFITKINAYKGGQLAIKAVNAAACLKNRSSFQ